MAANQDESGGHGLEMARQDAPVRDSNRTVLAAFARCLKLLPSSVSAKYQEQFIAFRREIGIERGQLDRMLRHSSSLRRTLIDQLSTLESILLTELQTPMRQLEGVDIHSAVTHTISSVVALLSALREPTPSDDIQRLSKTVIEDNYTQFDISRIKDKFPQCPEKLTRRLGILNRLRRLRFQDGQTAFLRKIQIAAWKDFESRQQRTGPVILDDTNNTLSAMLEDIMAGEISDTCSVASYSSGYGSVRWETEMVNLSQQDLPQLEPEASITQAIPLHIPTMPERIRRHTDMRCPFCYLELDHLIDDEDWQ
jgi:hypothetical protein